jgi:hypothetical protein
VAAYGFHPDNPPLLTEDWPVRPADHFFYAREKAEIELLLDEARADHPGVDLYVVRPSIVLGPHAIGAKDFMPPALAPLTRGLGRLVAQIRSLPVPLLVPAPDLPVQFVHEDDVGRALLACIVGAGPPGAYNLAGEGVLTGADIARGPDAGLVPRGPGAGRGRDDRRRALPAPGGGVGRSPPPPGHHGHDPRPAGPRVASPLLRAGGAAGHARRHAGLSRERRFPGTLVPGRGALRPALWGADRPEVTAVAQTTMPARLSAADSLLWRIELDPVLRTPVVVVGLLDRDQQAVTDPEDLQRCLAAAFDQLAALGNGGRA